MRHSATGKIDYAKQYTIRDFKFGLETEYLLADRETLAPYWHTDVSFDQINLILETISLDGIPSCDGLELEPPHRKLMPYVVEGYHLPDMNFNAIDLLPKGVEIRTPVCDSIQDCLQVQRVLFDRLQKGLATQNLTGVALSHHPIHSHFSGPQNKRRYDYWRWAMEVMTTYGPDVNVGIPSDMMATLDINDLTAKINYYAGAMTAFSVASPFCEGGLWKVRKKIGKSLRTYRRSVIAPPIEVHPDENGRLEFKIFDMSPRLEDFENHFLLFLTLLLDQKLDGRASAASRIYDQGAVAIHGWDTPTALERAEELIKAAERTLPRFGAEINSIQTLVTRLQKKSTPADDLIQLYLDSGSSLNPVLRHLNYLH